MAGGKGASAGKGAITADWGRLILRAVVGAGLMTHGWPKVFAVNDEGVRRIVGFTRGVAEMGFQYPEYFAWAAALSKLVGGALLILGLGTRVAALLISGTMVVALWRSRAEGWEGMELAALYLAPAIFFVLAGPGKKSLDALFFKRKSG
ncbi:MAG: DoxX family protein [Candidatus Eisenbacteria bacterium]|nr:DoxX family protein [Candidatus Eisenbacteria bacterium]